MGKRNINKGINIPRPRKFPKPKIGNITRTIKEEKILLLQAIQEDKNIDFSRLAFLVNTCHLIADICEQYAFEVQGMLKKTDPTLELLFRRSVTQIKNHSADMVKFVDKHTNEKFSEGFGMIADELKIVIENYLAENMVRKKE